MRMIKIVYVRNGGAGPSMSNKAANMALHVRDVVWELVPAAGLLFGLTVLLLLLVLRRGGGRERERGGGGGKGGGGRRRGLMLLALLLCTVLLAVRAWRFARPSAERMALAEGCSVYYADGGDAHRGDGRVKIIMYFDPKQDFGMLR